MVYIVYLITNSKQKNEIEKNNFSKYKDCLSDIDLFIKKYFLNIEFKEVDDEILNELENDLNLEYSNMEKNIKNIYKKEYNNIEIIKIDLTESLKKKNLLETSSILELDPTLSYILEEDLYNKNISYTDMIKNSGIDKTKNLIMIGSYTFVSKFKELLNARKIKKQIYFKHGFQIPLEYVIFEYKKIFNS